ncbi:Uncharacterised protein [Neisseria meningitidis]|nr:Uncharacterised protein [Neisseria meningitidis]CWM88578.1 Uncharacterised protein [Neisseria meningitidis]CWN24147.1 Uncharacterised protein [Neisseria meningitidis]CWN57113.1 Uncharacterised protein [Neisseria meningitidis]CWN66077.1 Uncharacterised protein [Neisseria meningitidis]
MIFAIAFFSFFNPRSETLVTIIDPAFRIWEQISKLLDVIINDLKYSSPLSFYNTFI